MNVHEVYVRLALFFGLGGWVSWMVSYQLFINYTHKNLKSLCYYLFGNENYFTGKLGYSEIIIMNGVASAILTHYFLFYKRKGYLRIYKEPEKSMYPNLTEKNALLIVKEHYKWLILGSVSMIIGFLWFGGTGFFIWLAERIGQ